MNRPADVPGRSVIAEPVVEHERASATPLAREPRSLRRPGGPTLSRSEPSGARLRPEEKAASGDGRADGGAHVTLRSRQKWFAAAVMSPPEFEAADRDADAFLTAGPRLSPRERLGVYRRAYAARLVECLADDYPALRSAVGEDRFETLCRAYITRHPSTSPSLNAYGKRMAEFCRDGMEADLAAEFRLHVSEPVFMSDLARLEWAIVEVIHAPSADPLTPSGLSTVPVEQWTDARLMTTPAFRLLRFAYPVNTYLQALREGQAPVIPEPASSAAAVYRSGATIWRMDLSDPMCDLLQSLASGETLGSALERGAGAFEDIAEDVAARRVMDWFREWVASGLFSGVTFV